VVAARTSLVAERHVLRDGGHVLQVLQALFDHAAPQAAQ